MPSVPDAEFTVIRSVSGSQPYNTSIGIWRCAVLHKTFLDRHGYTKDTANQKEII
jgi:hypothetical protein